VVLQKYTSLNDGLYHKYTNVALKAWFTIIYEHKFAYVR